MSERDWQELKAAISNGSLEKASLSMLLRYERTMKGRAGHELPPAIRDQVRLRISQKVTNLAVVTLVIVSILGGVVILLHRLLS